MTETGRVLGEGSSIKRKRRKKSKHQLQMAVAIIIGLLLAVTFSVSVYKDVMAVKRDLLEAKGSLVNGTREARDFNIKSARGSLESAERNFIDVKQKLTRPAFRVMMLLPVLGDNFYAVDKLAISGTEVTRAGFSLLDAAEKLSGDGSGIEIRYSKGRLDLEPFEKAIPHVREARDHLSAARTEKEKISGRFLLPQLKGPLEDYSEKLAELNEITNRADNALSILPSFFGINEKRSYFLAVQNNAELRATGGLIGNYGVISVNKGKMSMGSFDEIHVLQKKNQPEATTTDDFHDRYRRFKGTSLWLNANMSPDFPAVSNVLLQLYRGSTEEHLDGVIAIDPVGLKYLLEAIGPTELPGMELTVDAQSVVDLTLVDAYKIYDERDKRKDFLKEVATAVWSKIIDGDFENRSLLVEKMSLALSEKHILLYSANADEQRLFKELGYAGALNKTVGDYLQVLVQNHGGNKVDIYLDQAVEYDATIQPDGSILSNVTVTLKNNTPKSGLSTYVSGEHPLGARDGQNNAYLSVYVPGNSRLLECTHDGKPGKPEVGQEKDKAIFSYYLYIPAGEEQKVSFTYANASHVSFSQNPAIYNLDWQVQPVIRKPSIRLNVRYPDACQAAILSDGLTQENGLVVAMGTLQKDSNFSFQLGGKEQSSVENFKEWLKKPIF